MLGKHGRCVRGGAILVFAALVGGCGGTEPNAALHNTITIESAPESGAELTIRGVSYGETPVVIDNMPAGEVLVVLTKEKFDRTTRLIDVSARGEDRFVIEMESQVGFLTLESKPTGAKVLLDGYRRVGDTPLFEFKVTVGAHTYELRSQDYETLRRSVTVESDYRYKFMHELTPKPARLTVLSRPTNATIWLNDELLIQTTPGKYELAAGGYTIGLHVKGYVRTERTVSLGPNQELTVEIELKQGDAPPGMVLVPGGKFIMGGAVVPDERPQREVEVDAFYIDKYEVTNAEFKAVFPGHIFEKVHERHPVRNLSFKRACQYAAAVGKRLPTEAEWEKAARGVAGREYPWGTEFGRDMCNSLESDRDCPATAGQFRMGASPYGCVDMAGNLYEWTADWYQAYPGNADVKKDYGQIFRVLRGGSYLSDRFEVRCARRHYDRMDATRVDYGFRCVKDVESNPKRP